MGVAALTDMRELFELAFARKASDIHLTEHTPPILRIHGSLQPTAFAPLSRADTKRMVYTMLTDRQKAQFERELELDISIDVQGLGRFRVNVHMQRGSVEAALRLVPSRIPSLNELGLPPIVAELARKPNGLVLVTGPTGVGKTTTMAAMLDLINHEQSAHIIVIEDPIEYLHRNRRSIIKQREVYADTKSFPAALVRALRQDPNVIGIGEMRDLETISTALTAAETGHLVLATLHTPDAAQTIDRILDVFPPHRQDEIKVQLADCLQGVVSQQLLPRKDGTGRVLAYEVMVGTAAVRNLIREHKTPQLLTVLQTGAAHGMCTMDGCIKDLYDRKVISYETAVSRVKNISEFHLHGKPDQGHKEKRGWGTRH
ncbi:MAG: type IV pili twitching motility protein PilT [Omnitrophica WOR_2 bacterium RIFCSPHIGHO2_02_FULL_68_15]|nr:MAG: type IV pili twitching motility protein PilT [Omnitrophica WOR_2 bacterium RIFCSPHIGHO2_02_FULL_68_15]